MKATYRGCQICSERDTALGGWSEVYWHAFAPDGYSINAGFGGGTVREMFRAMKEQVDYFLDACGGDVEEHIRHKKQGVI